MIWTITPHATADLRSPGPEVFFQRDFTRIVALRIHSFVLESGGTTVLVDTGLADHAALDADMRARKGDFAGFHDIAPPVWQRLARAPDAIVLTSFGPYTIGGLDRFPDCPVFFSARGLAEARAPRVKILARRLPEPVLARMTSAAAQPVDGRCEAFPGLTLIEVGAHAPAALGFIARTAQGAVGLADPVFTAENLTRGVPLGWCESLPEWYELFDRMKGMEAMIPLHDPDPSPVPRALWHESLREMGQ